MQYERCAYAYADGKPKHMIGRSIAPQREGIGPTDSTD
jgi:hypothetical protein